MEKIITNILVKSLSDFNHKLSNLDLDFHNSNGFLKSDIINSNLEREIKKYSSYKSHRFKKGSWEILLLINQLEKKVYSFTTENNIQHIYKKNNFNHYMQVISSQLNKNIETNVSQMSFFNDYESISKRQKTTFKSITNNFDLNGYEYYIISYSVKDGIISEIYKRKFNQNFECVEKESLIHLLKPNYADLTEVDIYSIENNFNKNNSPKNTKKVKLTLKEKAIKVKNG